MKTLLTVTFAVALFTTLAAVTTIAAPSGIVAGDLDEPVTAFAAASRENNEDPNNNDNTPPENNTPPPPEVFGEPIPGKVVLFILDRSCSMSGTPLTRLKSEVNAALDALAANNAAMKAQWIAAGSEGPEPKIEIAMVQFSSSSGVWNSQLVEANEASVGTAKNWVNALYASGSTSWTNAFNSGATFGGLFDTIFFQSDGLPNTNNPWEGAADNLAALHAGHDGGTRFIAQFFNTGGSGQSEMQRLATRMDGKANITGVFSAVS